MRSFVHALAALAICLVALGAVPVAPAAASGSDGGTSDVTIVVDSFGRPPRNGGTFSADGIRGCASGTTSDVVGARDAGALVFFDDLKTFQCGPSGSFTLHVLAFVDLAGCAATDSGVWTVAQGTGRYAKLEGRGTLVGTYLGGDACSAAGIRDVLSGQLNLGGAERPERDDGRRSTATIVVETTSGGGTFSTVGIRGCASGTTSDVMSARGIGSLAFFDDLKTFACGSSGTFTLHILAAVDLAHCASTDFGVWIVAGGTGRYARLQGSGILVGTYLGGNACFATGIRDVLTGEVSHARTDRDDDEREGQGSTRD